MVLVSKAAQRLLPCMLCACVWYSCDCMCVVMYSLCVCAEDHNNFDISNRLHCIHQGFFLLDFGCISNEQNEQNDGGQRLFYRSNLLTQKIFVVSSPLVIGKKLPKSILSTCKSCICKTKWRRYKLGERKKTYTQRVTPVLCWQAQQCVPPLHYLELQASSKQQQAKKNANYTPNKINKMTDPIETLDSEFDFCNLESKMAINTPSQMSTVLYARCTPGLSEFFDDKLSAKHLNKRAQRKVVGDDIVDSPARGSMSVRRELRYEFTHTEVTKAPLPADATTKSCRFNIRKRLDKLLNFKRNKIKRMDNIVTSTPNHFLDSFGSSDGLDTPKNIRKWRESMRQQHETSKTRTTFRYQCGHCNRTWQHNWELVYHVREHHVGYRFWFHRGYRCAQCPSAFLFNRFLVWHCERSHCGDGD